jgi:hypothetical protein
MTATRITAEEIAEYRALASAPVAVGGMPGLHTLLDALERLARDLAACRDLERVERNIKEEPWVDHGAIGRDIGRAILRACRARRLLPVTGWWG